MIAIYVGKNPQHSSMYLVGLQLQEVLSVICTTTIATNVAELKSATLVLNICIDETQKILQAKRFVGFGKLINFMAANFEEFDSYTKAGVLSLLALPSPVPLIVHSPHSHTLVSQHLRSLFSASACRTALSNLHLVPYFVSDEFTYHIYRDPKKWLVPYNRVNIVQKNLPLHTETLSKVMAIIPNMGCTYITNDDEVPKLYTHLKQGNRQWYTATTKSIGCFLCTSNFESFGIYYLELLKQGMVGVFLDKDWVRKLLPDYPLIVPKAQLAEACVTVVNNYHHWQLEVQPTVEYINRHYTKGEFAKKLIATKLFNY